LSGSIPNSYASAVRVVLLAAAALLLFTARLDKPATYVFDEACYVPSARAFLNNTADANPEHPPLGKLMIAASMKAIGDNPFGWRFASVLGGTAVVVGMYFLSLLLLEEPSLALLAGVLTLLNNFTFVMARVAMLEVFILMFGVAGVAAWVAAIKGIYPRSMMLLAGVLLGCCVAVKWSGLGIVAVVEFTTVVLWARGRRCVGTGYAVFCLCFLPALVYCLSFWPLFHGQHVSFSLGEVARRSNFILQFHRTAIGLATVNIPWYRWIFRIEPDRGLNYLVGNWAVCWLGLAAWLWCTYRWIKKPTMVEGIVISLFAVCWLQWAVIPRPFKYYYYYSIAATFLCLALPTALRRSPSYRVMGARVSMLAVVSAAVVFLVFYPKMTGLEAPWDCAIVCISCLI
jgi:dolichyl-phosphate-mannose-protein mannosyltransferase